MPCELQEDRVKTFSGLTLFTKPDSPCLCRTAVYLPPTHAWTNTALNVVLWLHEFYVSSEQYLFHSDATQIREQVLRSGKDVVLAPFLGHNYINAQKRVVGDYSVAPLARAQWGERYLNEVLAALTAFQKQAAQKQDQLQPQPQAQTPSLTIKNLVIACHSGGGEGMGYLLDTLGKDQTDLNADMHYVIPRAFLSARLRDATFL